MIDTIAMELMPVEQCPPFLEMVAHLHQKGYGTRQHRYGTKVQADSLGDAGGVAIPAGKINLNHSGRWRVEFTAGEVLHHHNAYQLSFEEAEKAIRLYLTKLKESIPFIDTDTARAIRVDVYVQWRLTGDYDKSLLPWLLAQSGRCERFYIYGRGLSAKLFHSNNHKVRLYNKSVEFAGKHGEQAELVGVTQMPKCVTRLEVELRDNVRQYYRNLRLLSRGRSVELPRSPLRESGILLSGHGYVPVDGSPIFDWDRVSDVLRREWPDTYLSPATNARDLVCATVTKPSTMLVMHDQPYLRPDFRGHKRGNWSKWKPELIAPAIGSPSSIMRVPSPDELRAYFADPVSPFYASHVATQAVQGVPEETLAPRRR